ncbi:MAG: hypothetical protein U0984_00055, partial [Prosthecobacter sp.]|nr:hypothetical protein [Prosthecobacter sp.]
QRIHTAGRDLDRMESQPLAFFEKVRQGYLDLAKAEAQRIIVIDAAQAPEVIHEQIWTLVEARHHAV